ERHDEYLLDAFLADFEQSGVVLERIVRQDIERIVPQLGAGWAAGGLEPSCQDIDVAALHAHYLATARRAGAELLHDTKVGTLYRDGGVWSIETCGGTVRAPIVVNAAGAWATSIATM